VDGKIDYSKYSLGQLREAARSIDQVSYPENFKNLELAIQLAESRANEDIAVQDSPKIDVMSPGHVRPKLSIAMFRARCPMCGWRLPLVHKESRRLRRVFQCPDCHSRLRLTWFWRMLNPLLLPFLVPFTAWILFSDIGRASRPWLIALLVALAILNYWFERLEVVDDQENLSPSSGKS